MDALSLAVCVADDFFDHEIPSPWWWELHIYRLLTRPGWMVIGARTAIVLDAALTEVAA